MLFVVWCSLAEEISAAVPWIELAHDCGQDLEAPQAAWPRCFKTHCWYGHVPKGARYIVVVRQPADVVVSFFKVRVLELWWGVTWNDY